MSKIHFSHYTTIEKFKKVFDVIELKKPVPKEYFDYNAMLDDLYDDDFQKFLMAKKEANEITYIPNTQGHDIRFVNAWNGMIDGEIEKYQWGIIAQNFIHTYLFNSMSFLRNYTEPKYEITLENCYQGFVNSITEGNIDEMMTMGSREHNCRVTGDHYNIKMKDWNIVLCKYNYETGEYHNIEPIRDMPIMEHEIELKTGHLLMADWFRIEEFIDSIQEYDDVRRKKSNYRDIGSAVGNYQKTKDYLEEFNFISVCSGNSMPSVFCQDGILIIGDNYANDDIEVDDKIDEEGDWILQDGTQKIGQICCDYWWGSIIEKEQLILIVETYLDKQNTKEEHRLIATNIVNDYIEKHKDRYLVQAYVEPGKYYLYHHPVTKDQDGDVFAKNFYSPDFQLDPAITPKFILSNRKLEIIDKPNNTPTP